MKTTQQNTEKIASCLKNAIERMKQETAEVITDFHVQPVADTGDIFIYDDNDQVLSQTSIDGCEEMNDDEFSQLVAQVMRAELNKLNEQKAFDQLTIFRPFSFVIVDEEKEPIEDLFIVDDENIIIDDELLKGLDDELDGFLHDLLSDL